MSGEIDSKFGNYYGAFKVKEENGEYFACVENWDGDQWEPISKEFYEACKKEFE